MAQKKREPSFDAMVRLFIKNYDIVTKKDINRLVRKIDDLEKFLANIPVARKSVSTAEKRSSAAEVVLNVIEDIRSGASVSDIKAQTGFEDKKVRNILNRLYKEGKIKRKKRGVYVTA